MVKNLPAKAGDIRDVGLIPGWEDPLEENMKNYSSILAWKRKISLQGRDSHEN